MSATRDEETVLVLYDYDYVSVEGLSVVIKQGEELQLVDGVAGAEWWRVRRSSIGSGDGSEFYVPANYVKRTDRRRPAPAGRSNSVREDSRAASGTARSWQSEAVDSPPTPTPDLAPKPLALRRNQAPPLEQHKEETVYENLAVIQALIHATPRNSGCCNGVNPDLNQWELHTDEDSGRVYYYNTETNETSWEPPALLLADAAAAGSRSLPDLTQLPSPPAAAVVTPKKSEPARPPSAIIPSRVAPPPPPARKYSNNWTASVDDNGVKVLTHVPTGERWYHAVDSQGRVYYYKENSQESVWDLPDRLPLQDILVMLGIAATAATAATTGTGATTLAANADACAATNTTGDAAAAADHAMLANTASDDDEFLDDWDLPISCHQLSSPAEEDSDSDYPPVSTAPVSELADGGAAVDGDLQGRSLVVPHTYEVDLTEIRGLLNRCKIMEAGKKIRKVWSESYIVTSGMKLIFYKDEKAAISTIAAPHGKPEAIISLERAAIQWTNQKTTKRNVLEVACRGSLFLLQHDDIGIMQQWFMVLSVKTAPRPTSNSMPASKSAEVAAEPEKTVEAQGRQKMSTLKKLRASITKNRKSTTDLNTVKDRLKNLISKRPAIESLQQKGIIKESVFNAPLAHLCARESTNVPRFVEQCILAIEVKGLDLDGLYRISGNLAQIQGMRFYINQRDNWDLLEYDVHVLTGALKLFFRELPEPLIPFDTYEPLVSYVCNRSAGGQRDSAVKSLLAAMPAPNRHTLQCLLDHLLRVLQNSKKNRMQVHSLAIVFGPTLMWPAIQTSAVASRMACQNKVVEYLLENWERVLA